MHLKPQRFDFGEGRDSCPGDLKSLLDDNESITWRRKKHERQAMLGELLLRAGPNYKKHFQKREEQLSYRRAPERRVSAITGKAMWFNQYFYFRLALAVNTAVACLVNGKAVVCLGAGDKKMAECFGL